MRYGKYWGALLLFLLLAGPFASACFAADQLALETQTETTDDRITVTIQLWDYIDPQDAIRGMQLDVDTSALDPAQLHVESPSSLISDETAYTNTAVWNQGEGILRLNYLNFDGTLPAPTRDVMAFVLRVDPEVVQAGTVVLPVTAKLQMESGLQTTLRTECAVTYAAQTEGVVSVTITWGALDYTYSEGIWNPDTHRYEGGGWSDNDTGFVTVENEGTLPAAVQVLFVSQLPGITGGFYVDDRPLQGSLALSRGQNQTAWLVLDGQPDRTFQQEKIGTVTIQIGEE